MKTLKTIEWQENNSVSGIGGGWGATGYSLVKLATQDSTHSATWDYSQQGATELMNKGYHKSG